MKEYKPYKSGKVREVYDAGDSIIMVATDRISAFDHIWKPYYSQRCRADTNVQILVWLYIRHFAESHDFSQYGRYARIFPYRRI